MLAVQLYCSDSLDVMPAPGWQMNYDNWVTSANLTPLSANTYTAGTYQTVFDQQTQYFTGSAPLAAGKPGLLYQYLRSIKLFRCPEDAINIDTYKRSILISSYVFNGAIVGYPDSTATMNGTKFIKAFKISKFKPTNILEWENDEKNTATGNWNDFSNYPIESGQPSFDQVRHGKSCQVGRMDGSAARVLKADMIGWANNNTTPNDLWYNPNTANGH